MHKILAVLLIATAAGVTAVGSAGAKMGPGYFVCGPHGSAQIPWSYEGKLPLFVGAGTPLHGKKTTPPPPQRFYRIGFGHSRSCAIEGPEGTAYFIPAVGEVRTATDAGTGKAIWIKLSSKLTAHLRKLVHKMKPYAAPKTPGQVTINNRTAARPASYLRLYTIGTPARTAPKISNWTGIDFFMGPISPWTDGKNVLMVSKRGAYLKRDGEVVRIAASVAKRIRRAQPIPN